VRGYRQGLKKGTARAVRKGSIRDQGDAQRTELGQLLPDHIDRHKSRLLAVIRSTRYSGFTNIEPTRRILLGLESACGRNICRPAHAEIQSRTVYSRSRLDRRARSRWC